MTGEMVLWYLDLFEELATKAVPMMISTSCFHPGRAPSS